jgi:putative phage-type endonuclease
MRGAGQLETKTMAGRSAVSAFAEHCEWTGASAENDREQWLVSRRSGVGGSDAASILGLNTWRSELATYVDKISEGPPDEASSEVAEWGRLFEPLVLRQYAKRSQRRVVRGGKLMRSKQASHYLTTLDGVQMNKPPPWAKGPGVAEIKTTGYGARYKEEIPVEVQIQIQWELFVTGASWATCIWLPFPERRLQWFDIEPHPEFQQWVREHVDAFWQRVQRREPPDPDGSESSKLALRKLFPEDNDEVIRILGAVSAADEYERNRAAIKLLEERQGLIKNMLAATIRSSKYALLEDGRYWGTAFFKERDNRCPHCTEVLSHVESYRTYTLRDPRKKPFPAPVDTRILPPLPEYDEGPDMIAALEGSLPANTGKVAV